MDYEHFYRYLDSRKSEEIEDCVRNVIKLAKKHAIEIVVDENTVSNEKEQLSKQHRLVTSQQVWFQHAVWNKFGSSSASGCMSLQELGEAALNLCANDEVALYIVSVNSHIDQKVQQKSNTSATAMPKSSSSRISGNSTPQQRASATPHHYQSRSSDIRLDNDVDTTCSEDASTPSTKQTEKRKRSGFNWTPAMDTALLAAVSEYKEESWEAVAAHVGANVTRQQCQVRWSAHLAPLQRGLRDDGEWTEEELVQLAELVVKYTSKPHLSPHTKSMTKQCIDWTAVGEKLGRVPIRCQSKWRHGKHNGVEFRTLVSDKSVEPPMTGEKRKLPATFGRSEDALIVQREVEWGDRGPGLWAALEKEIGRPSRDIHRRWQEITEEDV